MQPEPLCPTCGKSFPKGGSLTQWIFDIDKCSCATPVRSVPQLPRCALCGLAVRTGLGSITHWIFKTPVCECMSQEVSQDTPRTEQLPTDESIAGAPYEFLGVTGSGGIATVYKARSKKLERFVAIKVLQMGADDNRAVQNFLREAKAASKLQHPNIVTVQDFGKMQDGSQFLVTEWIDGMTLSEYLQTKGSLSVEASLVLFSQVLDGLSHAHNRGVVHRDIKPSNIMLTRGEGGGWTVKIIDFGTAKEIDSDGTNTRAEDMACSPYYMSPEHATGETVDARSDLYSVGCSLFETLTGKPPFVGKALSVVMRHQLEEPPTLRQASNNDREFPPAIEYAVATLLSKKPGERFQSASEAKDALYAKRRMTVKGPAGQGQTRAMENVQTGNKRDNRWLILWAVVGSTLVVFVIVFFIDSIGLMKTSDLAPVKGDMYEDNSGSARLPNPMSLRSIETIQVSSFSGVNGVSVQFRCSPMASELSDKDVIDEIARHKFKNIASMTVTNIPISGKQLFSHLKHHSLRSLILTETHLNGEGLKALSEIKTIRDLSIVRAEITKDEWSALSDLDLQSLSLSRCKLDLEKIKAMSIGKNLHNLDIGYDDLFDGKCLEYVASVCPSVTVLSLRGVPLSSRDLPKLASFKRLSSLSLSYANVDNQMLDKIPSLPLSAIDLSGNEKIDDAGLLSLLRFKSLTNVDVYGTSVTSSGEREFLKRRPNARFLSRNSSRSSDIELN